ncbi:MAG: sterol desaturase family protein [Sandarakinorhabdus sp.]|nr:sterol desaturase family protein [Sandarakinorhabdus sp.]
MPQNPLTLADAAFRVFPNVFLFDGGRYLIGALVMTIIIAAVMRSPWRVRRLQTRRATSADRRREMLASLRSVIIYALVSTPALWLTANGYTAGFYQGTPSLAVVAAYVGLLLVAHDSWFYWTHRVFHDPRLFKRFHLLHHKSVTPTPFAAYSFNAIEAASEVLFVSLWVAFVPTPWVAMFSFLGIMIVRNVMGHAGVELMPKGFADHWFWGLFATTTHHDLHHNGSFNHNFGLYFTWWDRVMGTEHPRYREIFREITQRPLAAPASEAGLAA